MASESQVAPSSLGHNPFLDVCCFCFVIVSYVDEMLVKWLDFSVNFYASAHSVDGARSIGFQVVCPSMHAFIYVLGQRNFPPAYCRLLACSGF